MEDDNAGQSEEFVSDLFGPLFTREESIQGLVTEALAEIIGEANCSDSDYTVSVFSLKPDVLERYIEEAQKDARNELPIPEGLLEMTSGQRGDIASNTMYAMISLTDRGLAVVPRAYLGDQMRGKIFLMERYQKEGDQMGFLRLRLKRLEDGSPVAISSIRYPSEFSGILPPAGEQGVVIGMESTQLRFWYDIFGFLRVSTFKSIQITPGARIYGTTTRLSDFVLQKVQELGIQDFMKGLLLEKSGQRPGHWMYTQGREDPSGGEVTEIQRLEGRIASKKDSLVKLRRVNFAETTPDVLSLINTNINELRAKISWLVSGNVSLGILPSGELIGQVFKTFGTPRHSLATWPLIIDFIINGIEAIARRVGMGEWYALARSTAVPYMMQGSVLRPVLVPLIIEGGVVKPVLEPRNSLLLLMLQLEQITKATESMIFLRRYNEHSTIGLENIISRMELELSDLKRRKVPNGIMVDLFQCYIVQAQVAVDDIKFLKSWTSYRGFPELPPPTEETVPTITGDQTSTITPNFFGDSFSEICKAAKSFFALTMNRTLPVVYRMSPQQIEIADRAHDQVVITTSENNRTTTQRFIADFLSSPSLSLDNEIGKINWARLPYNNDEIRIKVAPSLGDFQKIRVALASSAGQETRKQSLLGVVLAANKEEGFSSRGDEYKFPISMSKGAGHEFLFRLLCFYLVAESLLLRWDESRAAEIAELPELYDAARVNVGNVISDIVGSRGEGKIPIRNFSRDRIDNLLKPGLLLRGGQEGQEGQEGQGGQGGSRYPSDKVSMAFMKTVVRIENALLAKSDDQEGLEKLLEERMEMIGDGKKKEEEEQEEEQKEQEQEVVPDPRKKKKRVVAEDIVFLYWRGIPDEFKITVSDGMKNKIIQNFLRKSRLSAIWEMYTTVQKFANKTIGGASTHEEVRQTSTITGGGRGAARAAGGAARAAGGAGGGRGAARAAGGAGRGAAGAGRGAGGGRGAARAAGAGRGAGRVVRIDAD